MVSTPPGRWAGSTRRPCTIGGKSELIGLRELVPCVKDTCRCLLGNLLPYFNPWIPIFDPILLIMTEWGYCWTISDAINNRSGRIRCPRGFVNILAAERPNVRWSLYASVGFIRCGHRSPSRIPESVGLVGPITSRMYIQVVWFLASSSQWLRDVPKLYSFKTLVHIHPIPVFHEYYTYFSGYEIVFRPASYQTSIF